MKNPQQLGYTKPSIKAPKGGWKEGIWYVVDVAFNEYNPVHRKLFFSGFIHKELPNGYNYFADHDERLTISDVYYLRVVSEVSGMNDQPILEEAKNEKQYD